MKLWMALYVSQASQAFTPAELQSLVARAQQHNALVDITGALLFYRGRFLQVIEGDEEAVTQCMERIKRDTRHHDVNVVYQGPLEARRFGEWTMREISTQPDNEPVVEDFWRKLGGHDNGHILRTAVTLLHRLTHNSAAAP